MNASARSTSFFQSTLGITILVILVLGILLRIALPPATKWYLNEKVLADIGEYTGHVEDVDLALIRSDYQIEGLKIRRKTADPSVHFVDVKLGEFSLSWPALLNGVVSVDIIILEPKVNFVDAREDEKKQSGVGGDWLRVVDEALPFSINSLTIHGGQIAFRNPDTDPEVNLQSRNIHAVVENLTNIEDEEGERVATASVSGEVLEQAELSVKAEFDPFDYNDFLFAAEIHGLQLESLNDFARAYANLDFAAGHGDVFMEVKAENRHLEGYVKPLFENVEILDWEQDVEEQSKNPFKLIWEGAVDLVESIFTNSETDRIATQIDIEGELDEAQVDSWEAVWNVVRNAFTDAFEAQFEEITPLTD